MGGEPFYCTRRPASSFHARVTSIVRYIAIPPFTSRRFSPMRTPSATLRLGVGTRTDDPEGCAHMADASRDPAQAGSAPRWRHAPPMRVRTTSFAPSSWRHWLNWLIVGLSFIGITALVIVTGGAPNTWMHLYYIPVLYVAVEYGFRGATLAGTVAGLMAGLLVPVSATGGVQQLSSWGVRLVLFVLVGVAAAWFAREQPRPLDIMLRDLWMSHSLRTAVRHGGISVHFQPVVALHDGEVIGAEALCRWEGAAPSMRSPATFIPAAERSGTIHALGKEVMRQVAEQGGTWAKQGRERFLINVNVSAVELGSETFIDCLSNMVRSEPGRHFRWCIEVTETVLVANPERARHVLERAHALGVTVALDDFGTGYSSLTYLAEFPIDVIKIDRSFIATSDIDATSRSLIAAVVQLATAVGAETIAEGIETEEQLRAVTELGCTFGQGYLLGRPQQADAMDWQRRVLV